MTITDTNQDRSANTHSTEVIPNNISVDPTLRIPNHIAFIVDGNRRWAKARNLPTLEGHRQGINNLEKIFDECKRLGVKSATAWVFSTENWNRSKDEVDYLFNLFREFVTKYHEKFVKERTRFFHLGRKTHLPADIIEKLTELENDTQDFTEFSVSFAMDYGGHDELLRAMKKMKEQGLEITKENLEKCLDTALLPPIDLIIRTGGEQRLSGFMSWQNHYAEFYFPKAFFPEFTTEELHKALEDYTRRDRRFGGDSKKK